MILAKHSDDIIRQMGVEVLLEVLDVDTSASVDAWLDPIVSYISTATITVLWQDELKNDAWVVGGLLGQGDAIAFTLSTQAIAKRDRITKSSITYEVVDIRWQEIQGTKIYQKVALKRQNTN